MRGPSRWYDVGALALRLQRRRRELGWSQSHAAGEACLSPQYVSLLESGNVNPSIEKLSALAHAYGLSLSQVVTGEAPLSVADAIARREGREALETALGRGIAELGLRVGTRVALLGIRGAGKSTVGPEVARSLAAPFVELDALIEARLGLNLEQVFEFQGGDAYRRAQAESLAQLLGSHASFVVAAGGAIVTREREFAWLRATTVTVWLRASPEELWGRVVAQGDARPMRDSPRAMDQLRRIHAEREPLYRKAAHVVETSGLGVAGVAAAVLERLRG